MNQPSAMHAEKLDGQIEMVSWINANRSRRLGGFSLGRVGTQRQKVELQTFIPAQDITTLAQTNLPLAAILGEQLVDRRSNRATYVLPMVTERGDIALRYHIDSKPLKF